MRSPRRNPSKAAYCFPHHSCKYQLGACSSNSDSGTSSVVKHPSYAQDVTVLHEINSSATSTTVLRHSHHFHTLTFQRLSSGQNPGITGRESPPSRPPSPKRVPRQRRRKYWSLRLHIGVSEVCLAGCAYCEYSLHLVLLSGPIVKEDHPGGLKELAAPLHGFHSINTEQGQHPTTRSFRAPQHVFQSRNHLPALISPGLPLPRAPHSPSWVPCLYLDCLFSQFIPARPDIRAACLSLVSKRETSARGSSIREEAPQSGLGFERHRSIQGWELRNSTRDQSPRSTVLILGIGRPGRCPFCYISF